AYAEDGDNPRWVSSLQIYAPNFSGNVGSTNITGALTNNTTGNAATASAGWPTSWSGASITSAVAQATHATNADVAASGWPVFSVSAGANITVTTNVSGANTNYTVTGSAGSGVTNGQSNVSFGTLTLTNTLALGGTNDADGKFIAKITSSNSPSTFNFTMQANPQTTNRADNVFYWGWNQGSGGGQDVANEACLYHGIEREWLGQFEDYIHFRSTTNGVSYRPLFYGITRDSGICQKIEKLDTWQMMAGSNHLDEILNFNGTNSGYFKPPVSFYEYVKFYDRAGAYRSAFTNGILVSYGVNFNPDGSGSGLWLSQDTSLTNNNLVGMTANYWRTRNATGTLTNLYQNGGVTVGTNSWQVTVGTDVAGVQINNGNGAQTTFLSLGNAGVADRTVLYCIGSTDNSAVGGHAQYDTLLKSKKGVFFSANDSAQNDMQVSNRWVFVNGSVTVTGSLTAGTNLTARAHAYTTVAAAPTLANIGATNVWFTWASNGSPGVLVASYYDGGSNIVSKTLAP
ncbi:MAG: hypothetical protein NTZ16_12420, partial [Verrucomicrobia bacterium]|nr:hypothetical protein [Verrucomicrobiota bacterium]